jgi:hypothetical protein
VTTPEPNTTTPAEATEPMTQRAKPQKPRATVPAVRAAADLTTDRHTYGRLPGQLRPTGGPEWPVGFAGTTTVRLGNAAGVTIQGGGPVTSPLFLKTLQNHPSVAADMGIPVADDPTDPASLPASTVPTVPTSGGKTVKAPWKSPMPRRSEIPEASRRSPHRPRFTWWGWVKTLTPPWPRRTRTTEGDPT